MKLFYCVLLCVFSAGEMKVSYNTLTNLHHLTADTFHTFINTTGVRPVYFATSQTSEKHDRFFREYDVSAEVLKKFKMDVGFLDCVKYGKKIPLCDTEAIHKDIYVFRVSEVLLKLSLETMFDVDSIVSNLLQLLYLNDIPILQTQEEREEFERNNYGKKSAVFCQIKAMGTFEHRAFLEVAHEFMDKYTFVVSTTTTGPAGLSDYQVQKKVVAAKLWFIDCLRSDNKGPGCLSVRFRNNFSTDNIRDFINLLPLPLIFDVPDDGAVSVYEGKPIHIAYLVYDPKCWPQVRDQARRLSQTYHATIGIVTVNHDKADISQIPHLDLDDHKPPVLAMKLQNRTRASVMFHLFREENIDLFIEKHLRVVAKEKIKEREKMDNISVVGDNEFDDTVLAPDDEVAESIRTLNLKNPANTTLIRNLDKKSFAKTRKDSKAMLVLFYMRYDPVSMTFQRSYAQASHQHPMKSDYPLTMIECFDWTDVCQKENVTSYPVIRVYKNDKFSEYNGPFDGPSVLNYFRLHYEANPVPIASLKMAKNFLNGLYPSEAQKVADILILGAVKSHSKEAAIFDDLSAELHGYQLTALALDKTAQEVCAQHKVQVPCLILFNKRDVINPIHVFRGQFTKTELMTFVKSLRTATFVELTALNYPLYYQQKMPMAILFIDPAEHAEVYDLVSLVAGSGAFSKLLFTWMDVSSVASLGTSILSMYTETPSVPAVAYVDLLKGEVFLHHRKAFAEESFQKWLRSVQKGELMADHTLPAREWKPVKAGYDFSKGIPSELLEEEDDVKTAINEHGLGFDENGQPLKEEVEQSQEASKKAEMKPMMADTVMKDEL